MKLAYVPAGEFEMGSPVTEAGERRENETQHHVTLTKPFLMATTHVTRARFLAQFVRETKYQTDAEKEGWGWVWKAKKRGKREKKR